MSELLKCFQVYGDWARLGTLHMQTKTLGHEVFTKDYTIIYWYRCDAPRYLKYRTRPSCPQGTMDT
ncbi:hypothetical protein KGM_211978 [Danaus plexippus plexippus]|uniref:Uncharacterized protein n=1 Tax=Danaus plexippus plexippus TaxID=278856 RepID=A0A212EMD2_DANPL|nr:hypothetical protein KGM_211978 [Danaus plexippus plexippus]